MKAQQQNIRLRILSYLVIAYMMLAFGWWSVLLFTKNRDAFEAKSELQQIGLAAEGRIRTAEDYFRSDRYENLVREYRQQEYMIMGEAMFFVISLVIGIWLINRGYNREMLAAQQRRNFLLSITHELKSPIASISLILETFLKRELTAEQRHKFGRSALAETERLHTLVNDLLLSAKLETSYQPHLEEIDVAGLFYDVVESLKEKHPQVTFTFEEEENILPILADRLGLSSVAINLLENAIKYTPQDPHIEVCLKASSDNSVEICVADNGVGIPDREKRRIFEKFYRVGNEDTRQTKGTGLGLFIVHEIVKSHHGGIQVEDRLPRGTAFRIRLPRGQPSAAVKIPASAL